MIARLWGRCARRAVEAQLRRLDPESRACLAEELLDQATVTVPAGARELRLLATTPLLLARARGLLSKEPDTTAWIDRMPRDAVLWDVGANVGTFALYAALEPGRTVLAFEPSGASYAVLCQNVRLNGLGNLRAYCLAFARETRLGVLNLSSAAAGAAVNQFGDAGDVSRYAERRGEFTVQGMLGLGIDDFLARLQPPFPTHLKVDVDGIELPIFEGAERTLRDPRLRSVLAELTVSDEPELARTVAFLRGCGLELAGRGTIQTAGGQAGQNHVFERDGARE